MDTAHDLVELLRRKSPEYLDLVTAETDQQFEKAFDALLERVLHGLEANKKNFEPLDEVGLSGVLVLGLNMPGLTATQEAHSNGHVDITIVADHCVPARKKLAEAKIWNGSAYHLKGLKQLLDRYSTGRETRGLVISYCRSKDIKGLFEKLRKTMDDERPCSQSCGTMDHILKWSFLSVHLHSSGEQVEVSHIGCNLCPESEV